MLGRAVDCNYPVNTDVIERASRLPVPSGKITHVIYHANCKDGWGAWMAAWSASMVDPVSPKLVGIPVSHGDPVPDLPPGAYVAILDFSWPREVLLRLKERVSGLVVLDHHEKARKDLEGLYFCLFDQTRSGAALAWAYFRESEDFPWVLRYVEDRDLWTWRLPLSREINARIDILPFCEGDWLRAFGQSPNQFAEEGSLLLLAVRNSVSRICNNAWIGRVAGFKCPMVISGNLVSEVGEELCRRNPGYYFAAVGWFKDGRLQWSLRSQNSAFDVNQIAQRFGGGGHVTAAGFQDPNSFSWDIPIRDC